MNYQLYLVISILISFYLFKNYQSLFKKFIKIDKQNLNYSFKPTPTGAGIIFLIIFLIGNIIFTIFRDDFLINIPNRYYLFLSSLILITLISFLDDRKSIDPLFRLFAHILLVYLAISSLKLNLIYLPDKLTFLLAVLIWIYILNIINFIDGTDGFLTTNFIFFCISIIALKHLFNFDLFSYEIAILCLPFCLVFLIFNKPPAKLFMGDAGSIFLGFLSGFFFLELVIYGKWNIAISLLSYSLVDCTICLLLKLKKGIMPWVGMYDYFFLKPVLKNKKNHFNVLFLIIIFSILNFLIILLQEYFNLKFLFIFSIILSLMLMYIFSCLDKEFKFLKLKK